MALARRLFSTVVAKSNLRAGIIGGMGPDATVQFYQLVIDKTRTLTHAPTDQDHALAVIEMNPLIANRQEAILRGIDKEKCGEQLRESGARVRAAGADFAVCVCNSAHFFQKNMEEGLGKDVPFLSIVDLTVDKIHASTKDEEKSGDDLIVGILGASGCVASGMYQRALESKGIQYRVADQKAQDRTMEAIYLCKEGKLQEGRAALDEVLSTMLADGVKCMILGCTELPLLMASPSPMDPIEGKGDADTAVGSLTGVTFFDPNDILADTVVRVCKGLVQLDDVLPKD